MTADLNIAEILYESGSIHFRYCRYLSEDCTHWIRHGLFVAYHENGTKASEGTYENGLEHGLWLDFYENGQIASEGQYVQGKEDGLWRFWNDSGQEESPVSYNQGVELA